MAAAIEMSVTALAINLLVPPTGARITTNVLVQPIGARTHRNRAGSTDHCLYSPKSAGPPCKTARCTQTNLKSLFDVRGALVGS